MYPTVRERRYPGGQDQYCSAAYWSLERVFAHLRCVTPASGGIQKVALGSRICSLPSRSCWVSTGSASVTSSRIPIVARGISAPNRGLPADSPFKQPNHTGERRESWARTSYGVRLSTRTRTG